MRVRGRGDYPEVSLGGLDGKAGAVEGEGGLEVEVKEAVGEGDGV